MHARVLRVLHYKGSKQGRLYLNMIKICRPFSISAFPNCVEALASDIMVNRYRFTRSLYLLSDHPMDEPNSHMGKAKSPRDHQAPRRS